MKAAIVLIAIASTVLAKPEGYFHQQYQYHQSESTFKNNELEHKNEDDGFYSKHGELDGTEEPKVNSYSQHTEYQNPKFKNQFSTSDNQNNGFSGQLQSNQYGDTSQRYSQNLRSSSLRQQPNFNTNDGYQHGNARSQSYSTSFSNR